MTTWLELYNYLNKQANNVNNAGKFNWQKEIILHNAESGETHDCDIMIIDNSPRLMFNLETIFERNGS